MKQLAGHGHGAKYYAQSDELSRSSACWFRLHVKEGLAGKFLEKFSRYKEDVISKKYYVAKFAKKSQDRDKFFGQKFAFFPKNNRRRDEGAGSKTFGTFPQVHLFWS